MFNDEPAPTVPESVPSTEPTPQVALAPITEPEPPEQPVEVTEEKDQDQAT